jgi:hypothetical protein
MTESSNRWLTHRLQDKLETEVGRVLTQLVDWQRNGQPTRKWGLQASSSRRSASASVSRGDRSRRSSMRFEASALDSAPSIVSPASLASVSGYERCAAVIGFVKQIRKHETVVRQVRSTQPPRLGKAVVTSGRSASMNCPVPPKYSLVRRHEVTTDRRRLHSSPLGSETESNSGLRGSAVRDEPTISELAAESEPDRIRRALGLRSIRANHDR